MQVTKTEIPGVLIITPQRIVDPRGFFSETFRAGQYAAAGMPHPFVQDNWSRSRRGVLRGLHLQNPKAQGKLVTVISGQVLDVAVDVRVGSPAFGRHVAVELSDRTAFNYTCRAAAPTALSCYPKLPIFFTNATNITARRTRSSCAGTTRPSASTGGFPNLCSAPATRRHLCLPTFLAFAVVSRLSMRFLVTGISGQIGSETARRFGELATLWQRTAPCSIFRSLPASLRQLDALAPEVVVNPAAYTAVDRAEDERELHSPSMPIARA